MEAEADVFGSAGRQGWVDPVAGACSRSTCAGLGVRSNIAPDPASTPAPMMPPTSTLPAMATPPPVATLLVTVTVAG